MSALPPKGGSYGTFFLKAEATGRLCGFRLQAEVSSRSNASGDKSASDVT